MANGVYLGYFATAEEAALWALRRAYVGGGRAVAASLDKAVLYMVAAARLLLPILIQGSHLSNLL